MWDLKRVAVRSDSSVLAGVPSISVVVLALWKGHGLHRVWGLESFRGMKRVNSNMSTMEQVIEAFHSVA